MFATSFSTFCAHWPHSLRGKKAAWMSTTEELDFEEKKKAIPARLFPYERRLQEKGEGENELVSAQARLDSVPCHCLPCFHLSSLFRQGLPLLTAVVAVGVSHCKTAAHYKPLLVGKRKSLYFRRP